LAAVALAVAGVMPPFGLAALPGGLAMLGSPHTGIVLLAALLPVPALTGLAVALQGFARIVARLRDLSGGEHRAIVLRVVLAALALGYILGWLIVRPAEPEVPRCVLLGSLNVAAAWLFLLSVILEPRRSTLRRRTALVSDPALLSLLIAAGGALTAPLALLYLYFGVAAAARPGRQTATGAALLGLAGFAAAVAANSFWRQNLPLAGAMGAAIALLPVYVGCLFDRIDGTRRTALAANIAKNRFLAALGEDLQVPLRALARIGADLDRAAAPEAAETLAATRSLARAMLLQLDDVLNYVKIDTGAFAPETRSFDLYRLTNGVVAALRGLAAERGTSLVLRFDPLLPFQLRGWPNQARQVLNCLITNAICIAPRARVRISLDAAAVDADQVTVRVTIATEPAGNRLETAGDAAAMAQHLGLAVADRLIALMGGELTAQGDLVQGIAIAAELPFAIDQASQALPLDLAHLPVLIVTADAEFVRDLAEPLEAWRAEPRWIGAGDDALAYIAALPAGERRAVLMIDGRDDVLPALSLGHRGLTLLAPKPYLLFVTEEARLDSVVGLADNELDGILPAPFTLGALRSVFHALWVEPPDWFLADPPALAKPQPSPVPPSDAEPISPAAPPERALAPPPALQPAAQTASRGLARRRRHTLIAASSAANRKIMASILSRAGDAVHLAGTLDEVLRQLEKREPDVLLLDLTGPPGFDYEAALRCRRARPSLTIVALSADPPAQAERRAREIGLDALLPKPLEPKRLLAAIDGATGSDPAAAPARPPTVVTDLAAHRRVTATAPSEPQ
jgi:CheY-like chemotaxis protein/signal transduction histidine kinase